MKRGDGNHSYEGVVNDDESIAALRRAKETDTDITEMAIDGRKVSYWNEDRSMNEFGNWVGISPGHHRIRYCIGRMFSEVISPYTHKMENKVLKYIYDYDVEIEAHGVYVLIAYFEYPAAIYFGDPYRKKDIDIYEQKKQYVRIEPESRLLRSNYKYEQTTGVATNSTSNKLSFKINK